jgi:predicted negative regulator of RcsB-dependent stress response
MATSARNKVIQVQRPAESLQHFQQKVASSQDLRVGYLKPLLIGATVLLALGLGFFGFRAMRQNRVEQHEAALAQLNLEVAGDPAAPAAPAELEKRMRERLPRLEALARKAPGPSKAATEAILASWRLQLDGKGSFPALTKDPWDLLRLAQKQVALGEGKEALATLARLKGSADPSTPWASLYWPTLMDAHRLLGDRENALKDFAEGLRQGPITVPANFSEMGEKLREWIPVLEKVRKADTLQQTLAAENFSMSSIGSTTLPIDFDIFSTPSMDSFLR